MSRLGSAIEQMQSTIHEERKETDAHRKYIEDREKETRARAARLKVLIRISRS